MSASALLVTWCLLLVGAQAVSPVQSKGVLDPSSSNTNLVKTAADDDVNDVWHVHGEPGHQWKWVQKDGKTWSKENVDAEEAKQADPEGSAPTPPAPGPDADAAPTPSSNTAASIITTKVNIDVYYETRCPGCLLFLNKTLEPLWRHKGVQDFLNVTLYVYGNSMTVPVKEISEGYKFFHPDTTGPGWENVQVCQHGSEECLGNLVQNCAKEISEHAKYMDLVFCMAATTIDGHGEENSAYECLERTGIDKDKVKECVSSPHGNELASEAGRQTDALKGRKGTPWVMVGGTHVEDALLENTTLLTQAVCSHVGNVPEPCAQWKPTKAAPAPAAKASPAPAKSDSGDDFQVFMNAAKDDFVKVSPNHV